MVNRKSGLFKWIRLSHYRPLKSLVKPILLILRHHGSELKLSTYVVLNFWSIIFCIDHYVNENKVFSISII